MNVPGTFPVALNCALLNGVPYEIVAGAFHVIRGTLTAPGAEADVMVTCVDALRLAAGFVPAAAT